MSVMADGSDDVPEDKPARRAARELMNEEFLERLMAHVDEDGLALTGEGGFLPELVRAVLERGLATELIDHLGYERGDPAAAEFPNSRNGSFPKTVETDVGPVGLETPRDRAGTFEPRLVPKGSRRLGLVWNRTRPWRGRKARPRPVSVGVAQSTVLSLRNLLEDVAVWGWAEAPTGRLVFAAYVPKLDRSLPRAWPRTSMPG